MSVPKISDILAAAAAAKDIVRSFEIFPARTDEGMANLLERTQHTISRLRPHFVSLAWQPQVAAAQATEKLVHIVTRLQEATGVPILVHLTCHLSVDELCALLKRLKECGVRNLLAVRGDNTSSPTWRPKSGGLQHASDLVQLIREESGDHFCIGVGGYPEVHVESWNSTVLPPSKQARRSALLQLRGKIDAGADFIVTQFFYDAAVASRFISECQEVGIRCPIVLGYMPVILFEVWDKFVTWCRTRVPPAMRDELERLKSDDAAVRDYGVAVAESTLRPLLASGACTAVHFTTMNMFYSLHRIFERLGFLPWGASSTSTIVNVRSVGGSGPSQQPAMVTLTWATLSSPLVDAAPAAAAAVPALPGSTSRHTPAASFPGTSGSAMYAPRSGPLGAAQPLLATGAGDVTDRDAMEALGLGGGGSGGKGAAGEVHQFDERARDISAAAHTSDPFEFANGRWTPSASPAFGDLRDCYLAAKRPFPNRRKMWGAPTTVAELSRVFIGYLMGTVPQLPWCDGKLGAETRVLLPELRALCASGFLTITSQPRVNGARSDDPIHGWGPAAGIVFQKAYVEVFCSSTLAQRLRDTAEREFPTVALTALTSDGTPLWRSSAQHGGPRGKGAVTTTVTWGVFPGREIITATVVDSASFEAWRPQAFELWREWAALYEGEPAAAATHALLSGVAREWVLLTAVDDDYVSGPGAGGRLFELFREAAIANLSAEELRQAVRGTNKEATDLAARVQALTVANEEAGEALARAQGLLVALERENARLRGLQGRGAGRP